MNNIFCVCLFCGKINVVSLSDVQYKQYINGIMVQNIEPPIDIDDRECLISGTCKECFPVVLPIYSG